MLMKEKEKKDLEPKKGLKNIPKNIPEMNPPNYFIMVKKGVPNIKQIKKRTRTTITMRILSQMGYLILNQLKTIIPKVAPSNPKAPTSDPIIISCKNREKVSPTKFPVKEDKRKTKMHLIIPKLCSIEEDQISKRIMVFPTWGRLL